MAWTAADQERLDRITAAVSELPSELTREQYEAACALIGIDPLADHRVGMLASFGDYDLDNDPDGRFQIRQYLATKRSAAIKAEQSVARKPVISDDLVACPSCGTMVHQSVLMRASLGIACPDCYDRMSG